MVFSEAFMERHYEKRFCLICNRPFYVRKEGGGQRRSRAPLRSRRAKMCSMKCAIVRRKQTVAKAHFQYAKVHGGNKK